MTANSDSWHLILHAAPQAARDRESSQVRGRIVERLKLEPSDQARELAVGFDEFIQQLQQLKGCYVEWDGSFVWRPAGANQPWVEGNAFDGATCLQHVELKTHGRTRELPELLKLLRWPKHQLVVQLVTEGIYVDVATLMLLVDSEPPPAR